MNNNLDENQDLTRKRKSNPTVDLNTTQIPMHSDDVSQDNNNTNNVVLTLSLDIPNATRHRRLSTQTHSHSHSLPSETQADQISLHSLLTQQVPYTSLHLSPALSSVPPAVVETAPSVPRTGPTRVRKNPTQAPRDGSKSQNIPQPYPWATTKRATVHSLNYLDSKQITIISGEVQCKRCERQFQMDLDLHEKFIEIGSFMAKNKSTMHDRAPATLMNPVLPTCKYCNQENSVKPVISEKKKTINWLFLLLGQMLGCCTLEQLKYFCKHTKNHRTGAKDRVLYLTYLAICKQLDPNGPFDR
ncbi:Hydroxyproline-rich glycoprotein family protein [Heracleum sosnowskyi]|uniref:Hydroxyproline-rich glycoprotein family protein n=1 Tax=Heracleum sosnowskyi TaxID=360622 RepID=A0AAD8M2W2_9APIA|nr:Hydroxyproline-rich glycoprotein family protein [Heracleum sosnowskyi]